MIADIRGYKCSPMQASYTTESFAEAALANDKWQQHCTANKMNHNKITEKYSYDKCGRTFKTLHIHVEL